MHNSSKKQLDQSIDHTVGAVLAFMMAAIILGIGVWISCFALHSYLDWLWPYALCFPCTHLLVTEARSSRASDMAGMLMWMLAFLHFVPYGAIVGVGFVNGYTRQCLKWIAVIHIVLACIALGQMWFQYRATESRKTHHAANSWIRPSQTANASPCAPFLPEKSRKIFGFR